MRKIVAMLLGLLVLAGCYDVKEEVVPADGHAWMAGIEGGMYASLSETKPFEVVVDKVRKRYAAQGDDPDDKPLFVRTMPIADNTYLIQHWMQGADKYGVDVVAVPGWGILVFMPVEEEVLVATLKKYGMGFTPSRWAGGTITGPLDRLPEAMLEHSQHMVGRESAQVMVNMALSGKWTSDEVFRKHAERHYRTWPGNI